VPVTSAGKAVGTTSEAACSPGPWIGVAVALGELEVVGTISEST